MGSDVQRKRDVTSQSPPKVPGENLDLGLACRVSAALTATATTVTKTATTIPHIHSIRGSTTATATATIPLTHLVPLCDGDDPSHSYGTPFPSLQITGNIKIGTLKWATSGAHGTGTGKRTGKRTAKEATETTTKTAATIPNFLGGTTSKGEGVEEMVLSCGSPTDHPFHHPCTSSTRA